jgi:hypothetical protein
VIVEDGVRENADPAEVLHGAHQPAQPLLMVIVQQPLPVNDAGYDVVVRAAFLLDPSGSHGGPPVLFPNMPSTYQKKRAAPFSEKTRRIFTSSRTDGMSLVGMSLVIY